MYIEEIENITLEEYEEANEHAEDFNLTAGKEYKVLGFDGDCIKVKNDLGIEDWYSIDYFV
jgi:hypothetical protein